jgi:hypothetical protein
VAEKPPVIKTNKNEITEKWSVTELPRTIREAMKFTQLVRGRIQRNAEGLSNH